MKIVLKTLPGKYMYGVHFKPEFKYNHSLYNVAENARVKGACQVANYRAVSQRLTFSYRSIDNIFEFQSDEERTAFLLLL